MLQAARLQHAPPLIWCHVTLTQQRRHQSRENNGWVFSQVLVIIFWIRPISSLLVFFIYLFIYLFSIKTIQIPLVEKPIQLLRSQYLFCFSLSVVLLMDKQGRELVFFHSGDFLRQNPGVSDHTNDSSGDHTRSITKEVDFFSTDRTSELPGTDQEKRIGTIGSSSLVDSSINVRFSLLCLSSS
jgi:hypothetical protein